MSNPKNLWNGIATIGTEPEIKSVGQSRVVEFRAAINRAFRHSSKEDQTTLWVNVQMWDNGDSDSKFAFSQIEAKKMTKGSTVHMTAELTGQGWTSDDGEREKIVLKASAITYATSERREEGGESASSEAKTASASSGSAPQKF